MRKIKHSFGSIYNPMTMETFVEVEDVAKALASGWGDFPKTLNSTRAMELHLLGKAYLALVKRITSEHKTKSGSSFKEQSK